MPSLTPLLPPTDTRFRPDQRLYEQGHLEESEREKLRLEHKQREARKRMEAAGERWTPRWFRDQRPSTSASNSPDQGWVYAGGYWEQRGAFPPIPALW